MKIADCLTPERVCFLSGTTKREAIGELINLLSECPDIGDRNGLEAAIWRREGMMSTGIGVGIGVPHVRLSSVAEPVMAVGIHREGLGDYESLDNAPVQIVAVIVAGQDQHAQYIALLAEVVEVLKDRQARDAILKGQTPEAVYEILTGKGGK